MTKRTKVFIGIVSLTAIGIAIYSTRKKRQFKAMVRDIVADEGYETAQDILFPLKGGHYKITSSR